MATTDLTWVKKDWTRLIVTYNNQPAVGLSLGEVEYLMLWVPGGPSVMLALVEEGLYVNDKFEEREDYEFLISCFEMARGEKARCDNEEAEDVSEFWLQFEMAV